MRCAHCWRRVAWWGSRSNYIGVAHDGLDPSAVAGSQANEGAADGYQTLSVRMCGRTSVTGRYTEGGLALCRHRRRTPRRQRAWRRRPIARIEWFQSWCPSCRDVARQARMCLVAVVATSWAWGFSDLPFWSGLLYLFSAVRGEFLTGTQMSRGPLRGLQGRRRTGSRGGVPYTNDGARRRTSRQPGARLRALIAGSPSRTGLVYRFLDADGTVLYVGKAKDLRKRLSRTCVAGRRARGRVGEMVARAREVEVVVAAPRPKPCCSRTTSSRSRGRRSTCGCVTTRATRTSR